MSERRVTFTREQIAAYAEASGDHNPIHLDDDFARSVGLPGVIAHGMLQMGIMATVAAEAAGGPDRLRRLFVRFAGMVVPGDTVTFRAEPDGQSVDFLTELILNEELSWGCAGIAVCIQSMALAIAGIRASGTDEQKKRWLPEFTNPDRLVLGGLGLTEPDSGSDALAMKTRATRVSDGYVLTGTKQFCTHGGIADYHVIYAHTDPSTGPARTASCLC